MPLKPWKVLKSSYVRSRFRIDQCELPSGYILNATIMEFREWANVVALTRNREVVLVKQYRHGIKDFLLELPGGIVEDGEAPLVGAQRELLEETGYASSNVVETGWLYPNPALQTNKVHSFIAFDAELSSTQDLDDGEEIEVYLVPLEELKSLAASGQFLHALHVAVLFQALSYLERIS
jgi:8-oxo-dGTP pyrophosphatase MutT (NUDIX family)